MIIRMQHGARFEAAEAVVNFFQQKGFNVQIRDNNHCGEILIAVVAQAAEALNREEILALEGVAGIIENNDLFKARHKDFDEAWRWFSKKNRQACPF
mgnify:CR=1 FL=1